MIYFLPRHRIPRRIGRVTDKTIDRVLADIEPATPGPRISRHRFLTRLLPTRRRTCATQQQKLMALVLRWRLRRDELNAAADQLGVPRLSGSDWDAVLGPP
ncbi:hypothetical protein GCM10010517_81250 [Streptosporangium fragile]|uniref:Integrase n=1 Tax=Streptosporangium fragile TaxID=46186 RepID=A0ABP6IZ91_9ACTN